MLTVDALGNYYFFAAVFFCIIMTPVVNAYGDDKRFVSRTGMFLALVFLSAPLLMKLVLIPWGGH